VKHLTVVIPAFNEAAGIAGVAEGVLAALDPVSELRADVLVVDDGSTDETASAVRVLMGREPRVGLLKLRRNFGKEAAIQAGLAHATGDAVVVMDGDLQHPPGLLPEMIRLWSAGVPVVEGVKRSRGDEPLLSRFTAWLFYWLFGRLSGLDLRRHTDFKLLDRTVVDTYLALPERRRFFRGLIQWLGFPSAQLPFDVPVRRHGRRTFGGVQRLRLSVSAITSFSSAPLQFMTGLGGVTFLLGAVFGGISLYQKLSHRAVEGFTTVILITLILGGLTMMGLGLIGLYLANIFEEIKGRPPFCVDLESNYVPGGRVVPGGSSAVQKTRTTPPGPAEDGSS
jgi:glycosyltransferase involved in cell wall biosynthesis